MDIRPEDRLLAILATLCAATVAAMVIGIVWTKSSQDFFQTARSVEAFTAHLAGSPLNPLGLRINLGLDNLFLILYSAFFVVLTAPMRDRDFVLRADENAGTKRRVIHPERKDPRPSPACVPVKNL